RGGGERDQAAEPADQGEREVLAEGGRGSDPSGPGGLPERGRQGGALLGPAAPVCPRRRQRSARPSSPSAMTGMDPLRPPPPPRARWPCPAPGEVVKSRP